MCFGVTAASAGDLADYGTKVSGLCQIGPVATRAMHELMNTTYYHFICSISRWSGNGKLLLQLNL